MLGARVRRDAQVQWAQARFLEISQRLGPFLKQAGFREKTTWYLPCSGFLGENLVKRAEPRLTAWYTGPTLVELIGTCLPSTATRAAPLHLTKGPAELARVMSADALESPPRPIEKPLRLSITDVFKGQGVGGTVSVGGKVCVGRTRCQTRDARWDAGQGEEVGERARARCERRQGSGRGGRGRARASCEIGRRGSGRGGRGACSCKLTRPLLHLRSRSGTGGFWCDRRRRRGRPHAGPRVRQRQRSARFRRINPQPCPSPGLTRGRLSPHDHRARGQPERSQVGSGRRCGCAAFGRRRP